MARPHLQGRYAARVIEFADVEGCQSLQPAAKVRERNATLARRADGTHHQVMPGLQYLVAKHEEPAFPFLVRRDDVHIVDAHELPRRESLQQGRPGSQQFCQGKVSGAVVEALASRLQQV